MRGLVCSTNPNPNTIIVYVRAIESIPAFFALPWTLVLSLSADTSLCLCTTGAAPGTIQHHPRTTTHDDWLQSHINHTGMALFRLPRRGYIPVLFRSSTYGVYPAVIIRFTWLFTRPIHYCCPVHNNGLCFSGIVVFTINQTACLHWDR